MTTGKWRLTTQNSQYVIDYDKKTITRTNSTDMPMRRDDDPIAFFDIEEIEVGRGVLMTLEPLGEGDLTERFTSNVVSLEKIDDEQP